MAERQALSRRALLRLAVTLGTIATLSALPILSGNGATAAGAQQQPSIVGTWQIVAPGAPTVRILQTYNADGVMLSVGDDHPLRTPQLGTWTEVGERQYLMRNVSYRFDQDGNITGSIDTRVVFTVDPTGNTMTGRGERNELDLADNPLGPPITFEARGTRLVPIPLGGSTGS